MYIIKVTKRSGKTKDIQYLHPNGAIFFDTKDIRERNDGILAVTFTDLGVVQKQFNQLKRRHADVFEAGVEIEIAIVELSHYNPNAEYRVLDYVHFKPQPKGEQ